MATGGVPFDDDGVDDQELPNWSISNGSLDDRLNNMDWGVQQKKANRSSEKNKKKLGVAESRLTNDISPESTPGASRRRARTPHSFSHVKYATQMSVPEQAELERLKQRINFTDLDERSIGSDSQGRATAANNQRQVAENKKAFNFLPLHVNTNKSKEVPASAGKDGKRQSPGKDPSASVLSKDPFQGDQGSQAEDGRGEPGMDSSQVVSKLVQIREYIAKASSMRDDLVEKNEIPANVERLSHLIDHLKQQEKSYLRFLQKILARENDEEDICTIDSAVGSGSVAESTSLNIELHSEASDATEISQILKYRPRIEDNLGSSATPVQVSDFDVTATRKRERAALNGSWPDRINSRHLGKGRDPHGEAKEELENLRRQHDLLKKMLQQQEQLRALQGRQAALLAMQHNAEQAGAGVDDAGMRQRHPVPSPSIQRASPASCLNRAGECPPPDRKVVTETTGSVSGLSITSELNDELNDLIQRFHNQLHDSQAKAVPDNRRQAESLSLSREVSRSRNAPASEPPSAGNAKLVKLKELQDKKHTMDKILQELHSLRDQTLNNKSFPAPSVPSQRSSDRRGVVSAPAAPPGRSAAVNVEANSLSSTARLDSVASPNESEGEDNVNPTDKLRKLKEVHKRLNELRELVHYYEQTSDMMVDTVNENIKDDDEKTEGSLFESLFDSDHENPEPITNIRNPQRAGNWLDMNSLTNAHSTNNRDGRLNTDCEINNRSATNLRSLNIPSVIECQYNRDRPYNEVKDTKDEEWLDDEDDGREREGTEVSGSSRRSSLEEEEDPEFVQKIHRLHTAKQKLRHLQELVAMVQSDDTDGTTANASSVTEDDGLNQQPNNTRTNASKLKKDIALKEKAREKFYEAKLKQQQKELKQLQDERQRLMEIQEKIQDLQWACPDLQLSVSSTMSQPTSKRLPAAASTPAVNTNGAVLKSTVEPGSVSAPDNELWSEMRRHQILREELRQRRKQLELLMAEHQRRKVLNDSASKNGDAQMQDPQHPSRNDRTMATWGGSTQCALDEDEDGYPSEETAQEEEEEEEEEEEGQSSSCEDAAPYSCRNTRHRGTRKERESSWKSSRPLSTDGNARPSPSSRQQQNISMRRQENLRWASELSFVEEKQHWQEQISQLKKQLDFSTTMCQTLMQDQQTLSYMLQTLLTSPYGVLPNNVGSPQVHLIMHQLNQCYAQLAWQQNNVQRLKKMLNDLLNQENSQQPEQTANRDPGVCSASPNLFSPFNLHPHLSSLNMPGLANFVPVTAGFSFNPVFPPVFGEFPQSSAPQAGTEQPQTVDHNTSVKTEYMAFPQPFESSSLNGVERKRNSKEGEGDRQGAFWHGGAHNEKADGPSSVVVDKTTQSQRTGKAQPVRNGRSRQFDEESLESLSSMPDPIDPTTVTKTFKSRKAAAQASLASKDKTPKSKNKRKRSNGQSKPFGGGNMGQESDSVSSANEYNRVRSPHSKQKEESEKVLDKRTPDQLDTKLTCSKSNDLSSDTSSDFSLFETLRETIYSEVATLISQNESRPHFLIELFHELQMLNTDYLRQRALYALQDIVTRHLTEKKDTNEEQAASLSSAAWAASNSELTPSESLATSDGDVSEKNTENKLNLNRKHNGGDTEFMDNESTLSTSSNLEPFANDDLGNTVIHLDKALARIREYERMKLRAEYNENAADSSAVEQGVADGLEGASATPPGLTGHISSDIPCPRIDTQQLDRQIKAIMREVIPFLKEHMDDICSSQLLISIRRMVLTLTQQNDESKEFVRFFHKQLGGILQDSLSKFAGRTLKECGEDLLVEISEILFNELAFFRLMQDLDNTSTTVKQKERKKSDTTSSKQTLKPEERKTAGSEQSLSGDLLDRDKVDPQQGLDVDEPEIKETNQVEVKESMSCDGSDREDEDDEDSGRLPLSIIGLHFRLDDFHNALAVLLFLLLKGLSKAETQALTNYGSGEDENEDEELEEFEAGPVDVQTSLQASSDAGCEHEQVTNVISWNASQEVKSGQVSVESPEDKSEALKLADSREAKEEAAPFGCAANTKDESVPPPPRNEGTTADTGEAQLESGSTTLTPESSLACSPDTDSPVLINDYEAGSGNLSQKSDEDDFVKVEDLPLQLSVLCEDELQKRIAEEQESNSLSSEIIQGGGDGLVELVGNAQTLKEPETIGAQSA
ncbi:pericentriolar material 1 protein isoform X3 [Lepisosteus oculatus]|uniref:pericentriolar material 1 protein isoform X3 n=1 Tax=Lepisosteus oculatus TaxID=7918 RepID=UPI0035F5187C